MHVDQGSTGVQAPSSRLKRASAWAGNPQLKKTVQVSVAPAAAKRYTLMLMALGEQKSMPIERPESGVVAVLQMPP
jgi:hypothetical protein